MEVEIHYLKIAWLIQLLGFLQSRRAKQKVIQKLLYIIITNISKVGDKTPSTKDKDNKDQGKDETGFQMEITGNGIVS